MIDLHTSQFDQLFQDTIPHLKQYPQMLPFVGAKYLEQKTRILFLGESHYIPGNDLLHESRTKTHLSDWYNNNSFGFSDYLVNYINTRRVVHLADHASKVGHKKPLLIYYNMKAAIKEHYIELRNEINVFPFFSYYNYFQRPAFIEKASIENNSVDNGVAFSTLIQVTKILKPSTIIFVSRKAFNSFVAFRAKDAQGNLFENVVVGQVPHPSCAWWHKSSGACNGKTGKQKFIQLLAAQKL